MSRDVILLLALVLLLPAGVRSNGSIAAGLKTDQKCRTFDLVGQMRLRSKHGPAKGAEGGRSDNMEPLRSMKQPDRCDGRRGLTTEGEQGELAGGHKELRRSDAGVEGGACCSWQGKLSEMEGHFAQSCPEEQIECPNAGCGETLARRSMAEHRGACGREEVACPCPGCEERMARVAVGEHVEASGAVHLLRAWGRVAEMEEKVAGLQRRFDLLTRVFTWSTDSEWSHKMSLPHTFTDGVLSKPEPRTLKHKYEPCAPNL